jgi:hypothetical protein
MSNPQARNFNCPETDDPCVDPKCTKGNCLAKKRAADESRRADELARQGRIRRREHGPEDIGL